MLSPLSIGREDEGNWCEIKWNSSAKTYGSVVPQLLQFGAFIIIEFSYLMFFSDKENRNCAV